MALYVPARAGKKMAVRCRSIDYVFVLGNMAFPVFLCGWEHHERRSNPICGRTACQLLYFVCNLSADKFPVAVRHDARVNQYLFPDCHRRKHDGRHSRKGAYHNIGNFSMQPTKRREISLKNMKKVSVSGA